MRKRVPGLLSAAVSLAGFALLIGFAAAQSLSLRICQERGVTVHLQDGQEQQTPLRELIAFGESLITLGAAGFSPSRARPNPRDTGYLQISSVDISPSVLHTSASPKEALVTVQLACVGDIPPHAVVTVGLGTYSSEPVGSNVGYAPDFRTVPIAPNDQVTVIRFKVRATEKSRAGKIRVAAAIRAVTSGVRVKEPYPKDWLAELTVVAP